MLFVNEYTVDCISTVQCNPKSGHKIIVVQNNIHDAKLKDYKILF